MLRYTLRVSQVLEDDDGCAGIWFVTSSQPLGGGVFSRFGLSLITIYTIFVLALGRTVMPKDPCV